MTVPKRVLSVDVLRGTTVCLMIIVNNGVGHGQFHALTHSQWNGMTLCDMVFPFFLFIMGLSVCLSLSKTDFKWSREAFWRVLRRSFVILLSCWAIYWVEFILKGDWLPFSHFRIPGVLPRIAVSYFIVALMAMKLDRKVMGWTAVVLLAAYALILSLGNGYENDATNILSVVDRAVFGEDHLYTKAPVDPEGLLGVIPSVAHTIIGFMSGAVLKSELPIDRKVCRTFLYGTLILVTGLLLSHWLPLNKRIWSPSYVLVTCGAAAILLSLLMALVDWKSHDRWTLFFKVFGMNPLFLYILSELLSCIAGHYGIPDASYGILTGAGLAPAWASLLYSVLFMLLNWTAGYVLYRKKVFIKV